MYLKKPLLRGFLVVTTLCLPIAIANADLISHYTLDGIAVDSLGVQDGSLIGNPSTVAGKIGQAISFNAGISNPSLRTQYMAVPDNVQHRPNTITISAWVKTTDGGMYRGVVDKIENSIGILLDITNGKARLRSGSVLGYSDGPDSTSNVNDGQWHLITGTFVPTAGYNGISTLYVDGVLQGSMSHSYLPKTVSMNIAGEVPVASTYAIDGVIDDVGLWNNALNAAQVRALYTLADSALNYHLGNMQKLFDIHAAGPGASNVVEGRTWYYCTGLTGGLGELVESNGQFYLQLDSSGSGVSTVPEPVMIIQVAIMSIGLLIYAWRSRR